MPASIQNYDKIKEYQESAANITAEGKGIDTTAGTLGDSIMKAVREDRTARGVSTLAQGVGNVMGQMVTDPTGIRERTSGMVDPFSVNSLTYNARAQNLRTLGTLSTNEAQQEGTLQEVIQAGANQLKARAEQMYAQAEREMAQAQSLENEWTRSMQDRQFSADEAYRQEQLAMDRTKLSQDEAYRQALLGEKLKEKDTATQKKEQAIETIKTAAQSVLDVIQKKSSLSKEDYMDALRYAVSDYNKRAFEEGGKALTATELAVISGTQIRTVPGNQANFWQKIWGKTPASASSINIVEDEEGIINKMNAAILGAAAISSATLPESFIED